VANKPDSHDICFIPDGDTRGWLEERIELSEGEILDHEGNSVGSHPGANAFTVGQRKGLKIGRPAADGKPRFVLEIRPKENQVVVGPKDLLSVDRLRGIKVSWAGQPLPQALAGERFECMVQVRAHADPVPATAWLEEVPGDDGVVGRELVVDVNEPLQGVSPGQTMVIYRGTRVLGQATIDTARSLAWDPASVS
jgi:Predicted tRNA(5-methylaminomethyl-2-thiouridylate) methyltransferase, contains the PP-loop ATPase domain